MSRHAAGVATMPPDESGRLVVDLSDQDLFHQLDQLYRTRLDTLRRGSEAALENSERRIHTLELAYLRRHPDREVTRRRLRPDGDLPPRSPLPRLS